MYCSKCGKEIPDESIFCSSCGNKLVGMENKILNLNSIVIHTLKFEQLIMLIATIVYPLAMLFLPLFVELYRYIPHAGEWRYGDAFLLIQETNIGWDGLSTAVTTILIIMVSFSITTIFCSFGERKKYIVVPALLNVVLLIALYVSAEIVSCTDGHKGHYAVIPHIGYILTIIAVLLTLFCSLKVFSEFKYKNAEYINIKIKQNISKSISSFKNKYITNYNAETSNNGKVDFGKAITLYFKNYINFEGRASKSEYWWPTLLVLIASVSLIASIVLIIPSISVTVRRLHDIGKPGWWCLIGLIPIIGTFILIMWLIRDSDTDNQWGPANNTSSNDL